jgi:mono/diheme cytochrome c family protein
MRHILSRASAGAALFFGAVCIITIAHSASAPIAPAVADPQTIADGKYLAAAGDCVACHTAVGGTPFAGGTVINTGFGKLVGPNLTPDQATGIGSWSDAQFVRAVKYGVGHNGEHLYPGMPYIYFNQVPTADILKIRAYLNTLKPVDNQITANQLPFPFNIRLLMIGWNMLFFPNTGDYQPNPSQSAEWNRGAYLVQSLGHCAACHTDKNFLGGDRTGQELQGYVVDNMNAPNLTNDPHTGIGLWSADDIATYLKTGRNDYADASGPMADVVTNSTSQISLADDKAIGVYLKSLSGSNAPAATPIASSDPAMIAGAAIYADECAACHTSGGTGLPGIFPALKNSPVVQADDAATITHIVLHGGQSVGTDAAPTASAMPAFGSILTNQQAADVLVYIRNAWGNAAPAVTADQVNKAR